MEKLINFIKIEFPKDALEIQYGIELLNQCIGGSVESVKNAFAVAIDNRDFDKLNTLQDALKTIDEIQSKLEKYIDMIQVDENIEKEIIQRELDGDNIKEIPDYASLRVDENIPHTLYDDYTYKRPAGFEIYGKRYIAKDWKEVFVYTCEVLAQVDRDKFQNFLLDKSMQGRKIQYFCKDASLIRAPRKIKGTDIFVMTNMSANQIRNVIERMLRKYNLKVNDYKLFLKADYTERHE